MSEDNRYLVPGLARGLQLLTCFSRNEPQLTGAELARRLDLPRASVFRLLQTLEQTGFVERVPDAASYRLAIGVLRLGFEYLASMELTELGRPVIEQLRTDTGYSAHLVVRDGQQVVFVAKAVGANALFHSIQVGARLPAHATVLGRVLLSGLTMAELSQLYPESPLPAYTPRTPTTLAELKTLIDADRAKGWGLSQGGYETGITTLAAPVFNEQHEVVAAISITVPSQQVPAEKVSVLAPQVMQAAATLSGLLSHISHPSGSTPPTKAPA
ncbi:IclR family transcriptional regulator [Ramlibacter rhizophilus]|uniref:IclR family transcriptional regulator n=1 Tax=Ramlibacter rhizophilus TaxID=1781167 RepID=A0A4Z0BD68_9BURK|nr:IclR family transcriptional regulator [Ramlibacter rhizophilus]TFY97246.1 IclR family transcriptional regulator [Ramlibacter rhizophilus]